MQKLHIVFVYPLIIVNVNMIKIYFSRAAIQFLAVIALVFASAHISSAQAIEKGASSWHKVPHAAMRIIAGNNKLLFDEKGGASDHHIGVHIKLDYGWKTYWRLPGDSGVPPVFHWQGSRNLKKAVIAWPAPKYLADQYGVSIGYKKEVVFPIKIIAKRPDEPVILKLKVDYGVCKDVCIPASSQFEFQLAAGASQNNSNSSSVHNSEGLLQQNLLTKFYNQVPEKISWQSQERLTQKPTVRKISVQKEGSKPHIMIEAQFAPGEADPALFIEASDGFYLPIATRQKVEADGTVHFKVDLTHADPVKDLHGKYITCTLVSSQGAREIKWFYK